GSLPVRGTLRQVFKQVSPFPQHLIDRLPHQDFHVGHLALRVRANFHFILIRVVLSLRVVIELPRKVTCDGPPNLHHRKWPANKLWCSAYDFRTVAAAGNTAHPISVERVGMKLPRIESL